MIIVKTVPSHRTKVIYMADSLRIGFELNFTVGLKLKNF